MIKKKRDVHKILKNIGIVTSLATILGGAGLNKYTQYELNKLENSPLEITKIEKALSRPMSLQEFQELQKKNPEKFEDYMKLYKQYEKYLGTNEGQERKNYIKDYKELQHLDKISIGAGLTGLSALLLSEQKKEKKKI